MDKELESLGRSVKGNYSTSAGQADGIVGYIALL